MERNSLKCVLILLNDNITYLWIIIAYNAPYDKNIQYVSENYLELTLIQNKENMANYFKIEWYLKIPHKVCVFNRK
jgi:hypothetical protein